MIEPISAWLEELGMPMAQVTRFQTNSSISVAKVAESLAPLLEKASKECPNGKSIEIRLYVSGELVLLVGNALELRQGIARI